MTKQQATKAGRALLRKMRGGPWALRVWENCGWHYTVETSRIRILGPSWPGEKLYTAMLSPHHIFFGSPAHHADPNRAATNTLRTAMAAMAEFNGQLAEACAECKV